MALRISLATRRLLQEIPGVAAVGRGLKERDGKLTQAEAVVIYVARKRPLADLPSGERILPQVHGLRTDIQEATFEAAAADLGPLRQGDAIGPDGGPQVGTLGLVLGHGREGYGLTNEHVVWADARAVGNRVRRWLGPIVGTVTHAVDPSTGMADAALVRLDGRGPTASGGRTVSAGTAGGSRALPGPAWDLAIRDRPGYVRRLARPELGQRCWKVGRTTGYTEAVVAALEVSALVGFGNRGGWRFHGQIVLRPADGQPGIYRSGDSGAVWCVGNAALALGFAKDARDLGTHSVATPLETVFPHLLGPRWRVWSPVLRG